jgi:hypothetical protein
VSCFQSSAVTFCQDPPPVAPMPIVMYMCGMQPDSSLDCVFALQGAVPRAASLEFNQGPCPDQQHPPTPSRLPHSSSLAGTANPLATSSVFTQHPYYLSNMGQHSWRSVQAVRLLCRRIGGVAGPLTARLSAAIAIMAWYAWCCISYCCRTCCTRSLMDAGEKAACTQHAQLAKGSTARARYRSWQRQGCLSNRFGRLHGTAKRCPACA